MAFDGIALFGLFSMIKEKAKAENDHIDYLMGSHETRTKAEDLESPELKLKKAEIIKKAEESNKKSEEFKEIYEKYWKNL